MLKNVGIGASTFPSVDMEQPSGVFPLVSETHTGLPQSGLAGWQAMCTGSVDMAASLPALVLWKAPPKEESLQRQAATGSTGMAGG